MLSHVALGLVGWGLASALRSPSRSPEPKPATKTERAEGFHREADELVRRIRSDLAKQAAAEAQKVHPEILLREKFIARLSSLAPSANPSVSFREALAAARDEDSEITAGALFIFWAQADPAAAVTFAGGDGLDVLASEHAHMACELAGERLSPGTLLPLLESESMERRHRRDDFLSGMARTQASQRPVRELAGLVTGSPDELRSSVKFHLKDQWPAGRLDDFGAFVTELDDPELIPLGSDQWSREDLSVWLLSFVDRHPDQEFAKRVKATSTFITLVSWNPKIPWNDRIAAVGRSRMELLARHDLPDFLQADDGPDLIHAFRHGQLEATDILSKLSARFPHYAETGDLPEQLHEKLWAADPGRAAVLLEHLPENKRGSALTEAYERNLYQASLDTMAEALRRLPAPVDDDAIAVRSKILHSFVDHGLNDYGPDYLEWIKTLPEPIDRREGLAAIARRIEYSTFSKAQEIRRIVGDTPLPPTD